MRRANQGTPHVKLRFPRRESFHPYCNRSRAAAGRVRAGPIVFEEIAERSGLTFVSDSSPTPNKNQPETMVAGVALFDYDNDGYLDVYLVNGAAIPSLKKESPNTGIGCTTTIATAPSPT